VVSCNVLELTGYYGDRSAEQQCNDFIEDLIRAVMNNQQLGGLVNSTYVREYFTDGTTMKPQGMVVAFIETVYKVKY